MINDLTPYLASDFFFNTEHPGLIALCDEIKPASDKAMAVQAYYLCRDRFRYNPYACLDGLKSLASSYCFDENQGYCIPKASVYIALCRRLGIPARLGLADVVNHLSTPKLLEWLRTDVFTMHGYVEVYIEGQWVKATPAFDQALCDKVGIASLAFDGEQDSIFHPFTQDGSQHMQYLTDWGTFAQMPVDFILQNLQKHYPHIIQDTDEKFQKASLGLNLS